MTKWRKDSIYIRRISQWRVYNTNRDCSFPKSIKTYLSEATSCINMRWLWLMVCCTFTPKILCQSQFIWMIREKFHPTIFMSSTESISFRNSYFAKFTNVRFRISYIRKIFTIPCTWSVSFLIFWKSLSLEFEYQSIGSIFTWANFVFIPLWLDWQMPSGVNTFRFDALRYCPHFYVNS